MSAPSVEIVAETVLPDTVYASAACVDYTVEVADSSIDPVLVSTVDLYAHTPGAFTFRKGSRRDADFGGYVASGPSEIAVEWEFATERSTGWGGGSGWTGQPLYVEWPDSCIERFRRAGVVNDNFTGREIIVGSLCGKVYFLDYESGLPSRQSIDMTNPIKGTVSLDPTLNGNLYVGQGIPDERPFGAFVVDLYSHEVTHFQPEDPKAPRRWGAYDSSAVRVGQFLFRPGENGVLYKYLIVDGGLRLQSSLRYRVRGTGAGMEASMGVYANYGYLADNAGNILCVNLNTMHPVWHYSIGDDTDHSLIVLTEDDGHTYVYTGCEVDRQGEGNARLVKLDALTGAEVWRTEVPARLEQVEEKHFDGGFYATSLPGRGDCSHLLFANCVLNTSGQNGQFMAIDRSTGKVAYTTPLRYYAWSSPVGFLSAEGRQYIVTADCAGRVYLIRGIDGAILAVKQVGYNFESSPVVTGSSLVMGSRGNKIYKMTLK